MVKEARSATPWTRNLSRLFALIIGIDQYESPGIPPLRSAIRDAMKYKTYLIDYLGVPTTQINMLLGKDASREGILRAFESFGSDSRIKYGDPIFIVYTGHGSEDDPPPDWESDTQPSCIQVLVPQDYCATPGSEVPYIPDRTIGALLEGIAGKKGNNITVVMDCCHCASGTRGANKLNFRARSVTLKPRNVHPDYPPHKLNDHYLKPWASTPASLPVSRFKGLHSHILIAACGVSEIALECKAYGQFSNAFFKLLCSTPPDQLRYSQILTLMKPIQGQNPQIEGFNLDRFLFGVELSHPSPPPVVFHALAYDEGTKSHFIKVGKAHGITESSTFDVLDSNSIKIGSLVVKQAFHYHSIVEFTDSVVVVPSPNLHSPIAIQSGNDIHPHQVRLYVTPNQRFQASCKHIRSLVEDVKHDVNVCLVDQQDQADLEVSMGQNTMRFWLVEKKAMQHGFRNQFPRIDALNLDKITSFLNDTSRYLWELYRTNDDGNSTLMDDVDVSFYPLKEKSIAFTDSDVRMELMPVNDQDLCKNGEIDIVLEPDVFYGIKITNNSDRALFPQLLYFDCRNLIKPVMCYEPFNSGPYTLDSPLREGGGCLTIGYGSGGMPPLEFNLEDGKDSAIGYLKLFIFTRPLHVFHASDLPNSDLAHQLLGTNDTWGTRVIPIIQRRRPKSTLVNEKPQVPHVGFPSRVRTFSFPNRGRYFLS